jgi:hypothetical protein
MTKSAKTNNQDKADADWRSYQEFLQQWDIGTLTEANEVYQKVDKRSLKVCWSYNRPGEAPDVCHTCLVALAKGQYKKGHSLDGYISKIISNEVISMWKATGRGRAVAIDDNEIDAKASRVAEETLRRIFSERHMKQLLASRPELQKEIIEVIIGFDSDKPPSIRQVTKELKKTGNYYSKYRIGDAFDRLRVVLGRYR